MHNIFSCIDEYYSSKVKQYGPTPKGVDWNGAQSQLIRFKQISKIINNSPFSLSDLGCGYAGYYDYLNKNFKEFTYYGYDLSSEMIENAQKLYGNNININLFKIDKSREIEKTDYVVASGIFSVKMNFEEEKWLEYILETITLMNRSAIKGFSFNMLTKYSDKEYMKENLYYADPLYFFDYCKKKFSKNVSLLHDYDLYEFTILVRKE